MPADHDNARQLLHAVRARAPHACCHALNQLLLLLWQPRPCAYAIPSNGSKQAACCAQAASATCIHPCCSSELQLVCWAAHALRTSPTRGSKGSQQAVVHVQVQEKHCTPSSSDMTTGRSTPASAELEPAISAVFSSTSAARVDGAVHVPVVYMVPCGKWCIAATCMQRFAIVRKPHLRAAQSIMPMVLPDLSRQVCQLPWGHHEPVT
ncbi:hypothetical protein COO60DRAFT_1083719 [Scenedesmus sp. NREL 46B-D3]|nr:hypothetical protein COO60DRAFT_1083719 [Scenedesmus sp. NREL 46B-D3]